MLGLVVEVALWALLMLLPAAAVLFVPGRRIERKASAAMREHHEQRRAGL